MSSPARSRTRTTSRRRRSNLPALVVGGLLAIVVLAGLALALTAGGGEEAPTVPAAQVEGQLPPLPEGGADPAAGSPVPTAEGSDFDGEPVAIRNDGTPKIILLIAHWCPICQDEVPVVQEWLDGGGLPEGVELYAVATGIRPDRPNYPPQAWLEREGWTAPVLVDSDDAVGDAMGLTAYPFWVFVYGDGTVAGRTVGALPADTLDQVAQQLATSQDAAPQEAATP